MIDGAGRLLAALTAAGMIDNPVELADALWLAQYLPAATPAAATPPTPPSEPPTPAPPSTAPTDSTTKTPSTPETKPTAPAATPGRLSVHLPSMGQGAAIGGGRGIVAPAARALPDARAILRSLRPLMRKVAARGRWEIDEERTVERVVEERVWLPVLRPVRERWLRLSLVVDAGVSMGVWRATVRELHRLFQGCGAFLQVRLWSLELAHDPPRLHPGLTIKAEQTGHDLRELHDPSGRTLLLLLSDAVGPEWYTSRTSALLAEWARRMPVALVQMLPENLWPRTALSARSEAFVHPTAAAVPSARLRVEQESDWLSDEQPGGVPLPLLVLEPSAVSSWARLIAGRIDARLPGVLLDPGTEHAERPDEFTFRDILADERIERFKRTASRSAWKLAGLLAAAPVLSLPILRLVRQEMLAEARQVHEAEVLLGGLLALRGERAADPDEEQYEFHAGVRERLLDSVPVGQTLAVLERVAEYVEKHLGMGFGLRALLRDPAASTGAFVPDDTSFAQVTAGVLERLGGHYARIVRPEPTGVATPASVVKPTVAEPPGPTHWIWVTGTRTETSDLERLAATQLARILVEEGYGLIVSGASGLMQLVAQLFVEFQQEVDEQEQPAIPEGGTLIQVEIHRAREDWYSFKAWLLSTRKHLFRSGEKAVSTEGLREEVRELSAELDRIYLSRGSLTIELFAPPEVIALEPAAWPVAGEMFGDVPLGTRYRVVVRDADRHRPHSGRAKAIWLRRVLVRAEEPISSSTDVQLVNTQEEKLAVCAREADAVIVIGGTHGPYAVAEAAQAASKPVLPWAVTGKVARQLYQRILASWDRAPVAPLSRQEFESLAERLSDGSVMRHLLRRLLNPEQEAALSPPNNEPKPSLWVLVLGRMDDAIPAVVRQTGEKIGRLLAEEGYGLVTSSDMGIDAVVAKSFAEAMQDRGAIAVHRALRRVWVQDQPLETALRDILVPVKSEWDRDTTSLHLADALILIGNHDHLAEKALQARRSGKLVLPLPQTSSEVKALFRQWIEDRDIYLPLPPTPPLEMFQKLDQDSLHIADAVRPLLRWLVEIKGKPESPAAPKGVSPPDVKTEGRTPRAWVLVAGTGHEELSRQLSPVCRLVARILAEEGLGLITGGWVGVDTRVSLEFAHALSEQKGPPLEEFLCQVMYEDQPPQHELGRTIRVQGETEWQQTMVEKADAVIIIGGLGMTQYIAWTAIRDGKPVLPLAQTGGDARTLFDELLRNWEGSSYPVLKKADFERLANLSEDGGEMRRLLNLVTVPKPESPPAPAETPVAPTVWVSVAGTATRDLPIDQLEASRTVGRILAEEGYGLLTGGCAGVDSAVARAFTETLDRRGVPGTLLRQLQVLTEAQPLEHYLGEIIRVPTEQEQHETALKMASAFITIGDVGPTSEKTDERARQAGKTVLPLAATGGGARNYYALILDTWENCPVRPLTFHEFQDLALPLGDGSRLRRLLRHALVLSREATGRIEPKMWVLVAGTARETLPESLQQACEGVGQLLAEEGYGLITGGAIGVDTSVGRAFVDAFRERQASDPRKALRQFIVPGQARLLEEGEIEVIPAKDFESHVVELADAVILLGGRSGTRSIAQAALTASTPVLPLASTGAYAEMVHGELLDHWDDQQVHPFSREEFAHLTNPPGDELVRLLRLVLERPRLEVAKEVVGNNPEVVISWSPQDKACAQEIADFLTSSGVSVGFALEQRTPGISWFEENFRALQACKVVLVLCSDAALRSRTVRQEVTLATREQKIILPLIVADIKNLADLGYFLGHLQPLRVVGRPATEWLPEVLAALETSGVRRSRPHEQRFPSLLDKLRTLGTSTDRLWPSFATTLTEGKNVHPEFARATVCRIGDRMRFILDSPEDGHLLFLTHAPAGSVHCLCPSFFAPSTQLTSGLNIFPQPSSGVWAMQTMGKAGREELFAVISDRPLPLDWMARDDKEPARVLNESDISDLLKLLESLPPGSWKVIYSHFKLLD